MVTEAYLRVSYVKQWQDLDKFLPKMNVKKCLGEYFFSQK